MELKTTIPQPKAPFQLDLTKNFFFIGSCFANNIGNELKKRFLNAQVNPFGTVFNPISIYHQLQQIINNQPEYWLYPYQNRFYSLHHYSLFAEENKDKLKQKIKQTTSRASMFIEQAQVLFITLGTAWVYIENESNKIVANCHKIPQQFFNKKLLTICEIENVLNKIVALATTKNPNLKVVFTLSPVRHLKDGFLENAVSKARLREAIYTTVNLNSSCYYFPAYEIFMDDLRDYRFYDDDLLHPNNIGLKYTYQLFEKCFFNETDLFSLNKLHQLNKAIEHKTNTNNKNEIEKHKKFVLQLKQNLMNKFPQLNFNDPLTSTFD